MKASSIVTIAVLGVLGAVGVASYISAKNYGNRSEVQLDAKLADNENVLASGYQQLRVSETEFKAAAQAVRDELNGHSNTIRTTLKD
jgi:Tfp pilus assembly protein PilE